MAAESIILTGTLKLDAKVDSVGNLEGWWLSICHSSVVEHWQLKARAIPGNCYLFTSLAFTHNQNV